VTDRVSVELKEFGVEVLLVGTDSAARVVVVFVGRVGVDTLTIQEKCAGVATDL
jgi:hypothetical protein